MIPKQLKNLKFCKLQQKKKKPFEKDWTKKPYSYEEISEWLESIKANYGVLCGYENLAVIDCDNDAFRLAIESLLDETFTVKTGSGGFHFYYLIKDLKQKIILESEDGVHLGEVQSYGTQVVGAGSIHPNGGKYKVENELPIATISCEQLYEVLKPFMKEIQQTEKVIEWERKEHSEIDDLNVADIWGVAGLKNNKTEYYGSHPIHGSDGGMNFWINPLKNLWHCFRCNSGGGALSAIAVKEGIIDCSEAHSGNLRGSKAYEAIQAAKEKYGLKETTLTTQTTQTTPDEKEIPIIWDKDLKTWEEEDREWIIDRLIPSKSACILTGKRGTFKTFGALNMAYSVASGEPFLNKFGTDKGKVIYLDKENGVGIMKNRTNMIKKGLKFEDKDLDVGFICFSQLKLDKLGDIVALEKLIEKHKPKLLIVDTYRRAISYDENDARYVSQLFVDTLRPLVEKYNLSVILIHHNRKGGQNSGDEMDELRGSSDLANYADIILKMERKKGDLVLKQLKNRNAQEESPIKIKFEINEEIAKMSYEGEFKLQTKVEKCIESIILWIETNEKTNFTTADIRELALKEGFKKNAFHNALIELQNRGIITNQGRGLYQVMEV